MMKNRQTLATRMTRMICIGGLVTAMSLAAFAAQGDALGYALLIQQSPADGGTVSPGLGVHKIGIGQSVQLTASPRPGYRFLYWLGDVSATTVTETSVSLDSPKMVIAVFERESFDEDILGVGLVSGASGSRSGLHSTPSPMTGTGSFSSAGGAGPNSFSFSQNSEELAKFGVPSEIPEPATVLLLGAGAIAFLRKRK